MESPPKRWLLWQFCAGGFAGGVFGFLVQLFFFWDGPPVEGIKLPIAGLLVGITLGGIVGVAVGGRTIGGWFKTLAQSMLAGITIGVLAGLLVYAPVMTRFDSFADDLFRGRVESRYQQIGIMFGALFGAVGGVIVATAQYFVHRK